MRHITDRLNESQRKRLGEIIRFGIVGVAATLLQYIIYWILIHAVSPAPAMTIGYAISFAFNFYASTHFTFKVAANARRGAGFVLSHVINYLLQMGTLSLFLLLGVSKQLAPIPMFCVCVPVNFILVRFFLKR